MTATEVVEVKYPPTENQKLEQSFKEFYNLDSAPQIRKILIVEKEEYNKFLKSRARLRTEFEPKEPEIDLSFVNSSVPFEFVATRTEFLFPSSSLYTVFEELDRPCGITKSILLKSKDEEKTFESYFKAEVYILAKYLEEIK